MSAPTRPDRTRDVTPKSEQSKAKTALHRRNPSGAVGCGHLRRCTSSTLLPHRLLLTPRICARKTRARGRTDSYHWLLGCDPDLEPAARQLGQHFDLDSADQVTVDLTEVEDAGLQRIAAASHTDRNVPSLAAGIHR